jgi:hypothetical protein
MNCLLQIWWRKAVKKVQKDKKTKGWTWLSFWAPR